jgi:hypothetical protein
MAGKAVAFPAVSSFEFRVASFRSTTEFLTALPGDLLANRQVASDAKNAKVRKGLSLGVIGVAGDLAVLSFIIAVFADLEEPPQ